MGRQPKLYSTHRTTLKKTLVLLEKGAKSLFQWKNQVNLKVLCLGYILKILFL